MREFGGPSRKNNQSEAASAGQYANLSALRFLRSCALEMDLREDNSEHTGESAGNKPERRLKASRLHL